MPEDAVAPECLAAEATPRDKTLLHLRYGAGLRVSEACGLRWRNLCPRGGAGGRPSPVIGAIHFATHCDDLLGEVAHCLACHWTGDAEETQERLRCQSSRRERR